MDKSSYCSVEHGDPYPPCWNPKHHCADCLKEYEERKLTKHNFKNFYRKNLCKSTLKLSLKNK